MVEMFRRFRPARQSPGHDGTVVDYPPQGAQEEAQLESGLDPRNDRDRNSTGDVREDLPRIRSWWSKKPRNPDTVDLDGLRGYNTHGRQERSIDHPLRDLSGEELRLPGEAPDSTMTKPKHCLLIVDDEPDVCDSVHDLLRREFRVLKANSAEEGCRIMQEEEVHMVMSDQRMPQITGVELLTRVKTRYPQAVRMLYTGYADLDSIIAAINQGHIYQFIKKPWQPEELLDAVRQAAAEYERLSGAHAERERLMHEVSELKNRVSSLESEVRNIHTKEPSALS